MGNFCQYFLSHKIKNMNTKVFFTYLGKKIDNVNVCTHIFNFKLRIRVCVHVKKCRIARVFKPIKKHDNIYLFYKFVRSIHIPPIDRAQ